MTTTATNPKATENGIHVFEQAGLGKAPFRVIGVGMKIGPILLGSSGGVEHWCGSPGQPMGVCKFCGQGIAECWSIKSSDGKVFEVGCDCVRKTGDAGMKKVVNAHKAKINREKAHAKGKADKEFVVGVLKDVNLTARLAKMPHSKAGATHTTYFANMTALDEVQYLFRASGNAGMGRLAKWLRKILPC